MIAPMKKATVLVLESRREQELGNLKRLGLLHPDIEDRTDERLESLHGMRDNLQRALTALPSEAPDGETGGKAGSTDDVTQPVSLEDALAASERVLKVAETLRDHTEAHSKAIQELTRIEPWGEFSPADITGLGKNEIEIRLFSMGRKEFRKKGPAGAFVLATESRAVRFAVIWHHGVTESGMTPDEVVAIPGVMAFVLPEAPPAELRNRRDESERAIESARETLEAFFVDRATIEAGVELADRRIRDAQVRLGMDTADRIAHITGYIPESDVDSLRQAASNNGWGVLLRDPDVEDPVPTKIQNPAWIRIIRPIFNLLGVVPGYRERDISFFFLLFFIVFVGMIIGDAGYGAILLLGSIIGLIKSRSNRAAREGLALLTILSLSTLAWGAMTGNWFGFEPIAQLVPFKYLLIPALNSFDPASTQAVQSVCFLLAALHLSVAHLWNFVREIRQRPAIKAFAQLGWLSAVLGLYFLVGSLFLGTAMPSYALYMIAGGIGGVFLFSGQSPETGFFGGIARGLGNAFTIVFDGIGAFSDIISYIRLFAVGLASVAIAQAFNSMAASVGGGASGVILGIVILGFGHTLNLIMGGLAVVVHGVRLNLLEFSGHLGMEWTGVEYQPFSETSK